MDDTAEGWIGPPQNPGGTNPPAMKEDPPVTSVEEPTEELPETDPAYGDRAPGEVPADADQGDRSPAESPFQSVEAVAKEVVQGRWGIGQSRRAALKKAGYDPNEVAEEVKKILNRR